MTEHVTASVEYPPPVRNLIVALAVRLDVLTARVAALEVGGDGWLARFDPVTGLARRDPDDDPDIEDYDEQQASDAAAYAGRCPAYRGCEICEASHRAEAEDADARGEAQRDRDAYHGSMLDAEIQDRHTPIGERDA